MSSTNSCLNFNYSIEDRDVTYVSVVNVLTVVLNIVLSVTATLENLLVIGSIWNTRVLHTPSNVFICCLACTDLLTGLFVQPSLVVYKIAEILGNSRVSCLWFIISFLAGNVVSVVTLLTLTGIAIDRFLAVYLHLKYQDVISVYCVLKVFALFWVIALAPVAVRMLSTAKAYSVIVLFLLVSCFLLCFLSYFRILKVTRRHQRQIRNLSHAAAAASNSARDSFHGNHGNHGNSYDSQENANATKVRRTSITMLLIAGTFYISYLPLLGFMVAISIYSYTSPIKAWANIAKTIVFAGSSVNPVLYCLRIKEIRRAVLASMCKILRRPVNPIILSPATNRRQVSLAQVSNTFRTNSGAIIDIDA